MRLPPFSNLFRTFNYSRFARVRPTIQPSLRNTTTLKSMPLVPAFISSFFGSSSIPQQKMSYPDERTPDEWRAVLTKEQFRILREKGTEPAGSGKYDKFYPESGVYTCAGCNTPLYKANHKFKSGCGWPAYFDSIPGAVTRHVDNSWGMSRTEICCANCGGHLGHVFKGEGYPTPTDERHCVNSVSLNFSPEDKPVQDGTKESKA
ncbi:SelR-domain-containing protein [Hypomontagnella submonticulosa]|nr:SelR-domain-containing protein [Hypomontagnella submonticulosa]